MLRYDLKDIYRLAEVDHHQHKTAATASTAAAADFASAGPRIMQTLTSNNHHEQAGGIVDFIRSLRLSDRLWRRRGSNFRRRERRGRFGTGTSQTIMHSIDESDARLQLPIPIRRTIGDGPRGPTKLWDVYGGRKVVADAGLTPVIATLWSPGTLGSPHPLEVAYGYTSRSTVSQHSHRLAADNAGTISSRRPFYATPSDQSRVRNAAAVQADAPGAGHYYYQHHDRPLECGTSTSKPPRSTSATNVYSFPASVTRASRASRRVAATRELLLLSASPSDEVNNSGIGSAKQQRREGYKSASHRSSAAPSG